MLACGADVPGLNVHRVTSCHTQRHRHYKPANCLHRGSYRSRNLDIVMLCLPTVCAKVCKKYTFCAPPRHSQKCNEMWHRYEPQQVLTA